jgi:serine phosphatase RsbU (regulator of sigma subunit)
MPGLGSVVVLIVGLALTAGLTWAAAEADDRSTTSLLGLEVRQVASALTLAIPQIQIQLSDALAVADTTGSPATFASLVTKQGSGAFVSESLWERSGGGTKLLVTFGSTPLLVSTGEDGRFFADLKDTSKLQVTRILPGSPRRVGYAVTDASSGPFVVYAESDLPQSRHFRVQPSSPFGQLNYALYLGRSQRPSQLIETSIEAGMGNPRAVASAPLGDSAITVVGVPRVALTSSVSRALPWIALIVGLALTIASAATIEYVSRRRKEAERLSSELDRLYARQYSIAETLQRALLPQRLPELAGVDVAARYVTGTRDVAVGGDWYDVVPIDTERFVFIVGDVSGRGVSAAAVMASVRFASRGFALEGHPPDAILSHLSRTIEIGADGHFATVLCGLVHVASRTVTLASAGHLPPILKTPEGASAVEVVPDPPIGVPSGTHTSSVVFSVPEGSTLLAFTDGLIERRDIALNDAMKRLEDVLAADQSPLDSLLGNVIEELTMGAPEDDVAVLGIRWRT